MSRKYVFATILSLYFFGLNSPALAQTSTEPGGTPADTALAIQNPDEYAWRLFFFLSRQALPGKAGVPDPGKPGLAQYDPDRDVVWETWALETGGLPGFLGPGEKNHSEVFLDKGQRPVAWDSLQRKNPIKTLDVNLTELTSSLKAKLFTSEGAFKPFITFPRDFEVRMNESTFNTVRDQGLYSVEGLEAKYKQAQQIYTADISAKKDPVTIRREADVIKFETMSKEVKAKWVKLDATDEKQKARYHWRTVEEGNANGSITKEVWGLAGLHILTKDLPNWFWADFEQVDWEDKQPSGSPDPRVSVDSTTRGPNAPAGKDGIRNETVGTKWQYYRLRGTQTNFVDREGNHLEVSNTLIEPVNFGPSSCMTCHARASVGLRDDVNQKVSPPLAVKSVGPAFVSGPPDPTSYINGDKLLFIQTDFLWSMPFRAHSENE